MTVEGEEDPRNDEKLSLMGEHQGKLFNLAQKLGNSPISFDTATKILTNGDETFQHIIEQIKRLDITSIWNIILFVTIILGRK